MKSAEKTEPIPYGFHCCGTCGYSVTWRTDGDSRTGICGKDGAKKKGQVVRPRDACQGWRR